MLAYDTLCVNYCAHSSLVWFQTNLERCPPELASEIDKSLSKHENDVLEVELKRVLSTGRLSGKRGEMDYSTIDVDDLGVLLGLYS